MAHPRELVFALSFFRGCWKYGPIIGTIIENVQFAVQKEIFRAVLKEIFPKNTFFYHTTTYSRVCSSDHTCTKNSFLVGGFGSRRDLLRKKFWGP